MLPKHDESYTLDPWANRILDADVFGIDWNGPEGCGRMMVVVLLSTQKGCGPPLSKNS